ncbi:MAG: NF038143 family protein [Desulfobacterales bacterium]|nr:MAG: NF038143 family protein [Desulfobacterales bacterium]
MDKYDLIMSAETQFAREVTLGVIVQQPLSVWHYLIPGMFIFDFLRRNTAISRYTKHFLFPRKLALDAAQSLRGGDEKAAVNARVETQIGDWLKALNLYSWQLAQAQRAAVAVLTEHYLKLLEADGATYYDLLADAYHSREAYEAHLHALTSSENEVDQAIIAQLGASAKLKEKLLLEAQQVELRRQKILEDIF